LATSPAARFAPASTAAMIAVVTGSIFSVPPGIESDGQTLHTERHDPHLIQIN
jgi:hypothetical protein